MLVELWMMFWFVNWEIFFFNFISGFFAKYVEPSAHVHAFWNTQKGPCNTMVDSRLCRGLHLYMMNYHLQRQQQ